MVSGLRKRTYSPLGLRERLVVSPREAGILLVFDQDDVGEFLPHHFRRAIDGVVVHHQDFDRARRQGLTGAGSVGPGLMANGKAADRFLDRSQRLFEEVLYVVIDDDYR